ncbi:transcription initiation factor TFIID subunit 4 [Bombina bombina]|uniref:transcription initiation factor TFIID subunit 4 n=1 Tax=Bombina bombina TaxID=8345 RepID=UPI00235A819C|nr:transcription initiation factor TFIID subunit 4 [Bombina bombina]
MAAGSDLLDEVFFNTDVDEKVVSDLVGSLESQLAAAAHHHHHHHHHHHQQGPAEARGQALANHVANPGVGAGSAGGQAEAKIVLPSDMPKTGAPGVQGGVINNSRQQTTAPPDGAQSAGPEASGALNQAKAGVLGTMTTALPNHSSGNGKNVTLQTLNGSNVLMNSHGPPGHGTPFHGNSNPSTLVNNGPVSVTKGGGVNTVIQTSFLGTTNVSASVISSSSTSTAGATGPPTCMAGPPTTVALVRPLVHQGTPATQNGSNTVINSPLPTSAGVTLQMNSQPNPASTQAIKSESPKTIIQTPPQSQPHSSNMVIGQTMQAGHPGPGGTVSTPGPPVGIGKATISTVPTSLPRTPTAPAGGIRATINPPMLAPRVPQPPQNSPNIQNFQLPPGMVLVRSENGQLLMIPQQTLAQMQAQVQAQAHSQSQNAMATRPATPTSAPNVQISAVQSAGAPLLARQVTPTTIIKQVSQTPTTVQQTTTLQRPPVVQNQIVLGSTAQTTTLGTAVQTGTPQRTAQGAATPNAPTTETMENVKKCKNFLSTLIKLASSGKQSSETAANVKELVQNLLDGKIEAEDFTSRLYRELNSSPQPYLVPFLKRSLPALRQLTPDSAAFIQQSQQQQPPAQATTTLTAVMLSGSVQRTAGKTTSTVTNALQQPVISLTQPAQSKPGQPAPLVIQQAHKAGAVVRPPQVTLTQTPMVALRQPQSRIMLTTPQQIHLNQLQTVPVVKPTVLPGGKTMSTLSTLQASMQKNKIKEPGGGSFRDDDDINDVASMAGVNLSEESARILATNSDLVGTLTRSCKDETFLLPSLLQRRILEIGKKYGVTEIHPDVVGYVSHATQQRLQNIVEKVSETAQQKNFSHKEDDRYEQSSDVRTQLKFFEQLDQIEKQRKDEQEREILMRAAKSRSRQEDPEQLRLKQKAKEMQQQELAQMRQRDANLTALAAIGPRKKRKLESPGPGSGSESSSTSTTTAGSSGGQSSRQFTRQRITRVNLRDLIFCLENERETSHSLLLYKAFLK